MPAARAWLEPHAHPTGAAIRPLPHSSRFAWRDTPANLEEQFHGSRKQVLHISSKPNELGRTQLATGVTVAQYGDRYVFDTLLDVVTGDTIEVANPAINLYRVLDSVFIGQASCGLMLEDLQYDQITLVGSGRTITRVTTRVQWPCVLKLPNAIRDAKNVALTHVFLRGVEVDAHTGQAGRNSTDATSNVTTTFYSHNNDSYGMFVEGVESSNQIISNTSNKTPFHIIHATDTDLAAQVCNVTETGLLEWGQPYGGTISTVSVAVEGMDQEPLKCQAASFEFVVTL